MKRHVSHIKIWGNNEIWVYRADRIGHSVTSMKYPGPSESSKARVVQQSSKCDITIKYNLITNVHFCFTVVDTDTRKYIRKLTVEVSRGVLALARAEELARDAYLHPGESLDSLSTARLAGGMYIIELKNRQEGYVG